MEIVEMTSPCFPLQEGAIENVKTKDGDIVVLYKVSQPTPTATIFFEQASAMNKMIKGITGVLVIKKCPELLIVSRANWYSHKLRNLFLFRILSLGRLQKRLW